MNWQETNYRGFVFFGTPVEKMSKRDLMRALVWCSRMGKAAWEKIDKLESDLVAAKKIVEEDLT